MRPKSDIDLLVVRPDTVDADDPQWRTQLDGLASSVTAWTGNDTRILEFSVREARTGLAVGPRFWWWPPPVQPSWPITR
jgi:hypothetical protein